MSNPSNNRPASDQDAGRTGQSPVNNSNMSIPHNLDQFHLPPSDFKLSRRTPSVVYAYLDESGAAIGAIARFEAGTRKPDKKTFRQLRYQPASPKANGAGFVVGRGNTIFPLYQLANLREKLGTNPKQEVYFVEGEKCVDALASRGLLATCISGGSSAKIEPSILEPLRGHEVVVLLDCDESGRAFGNRVAIALSGVAASIKVIDLASHKNDGYDIADWLGESNPLSNLERMVNTSPKWEPDSENGPQPVLINMANVEPREIEWLWLDRIPMGAISMIVGDPGLGKSFLALYIASRVTRGKGFPDCSQPAPEGDVILLDAENGLANILRPRLDAVGADTSKIRVLTSVLRTTKHGSQEGPVSLDADLEALDIALEKAPNTKLVIVDPVSAYLPNIDSNSNTDVRSVLAPLAALAEKRNVAVILVSHTNKGQGRAIHRVIGSTGFAGAARSVWCVDRDHNDKDKRLFLPIKNNNGNDQTGLAFKIQDNAIHWYDEVIHQTASDSLARQSEHAIPSIREEAQEWLRDLLQDAGVGSTDVFKQAEEAGFSKRTIQRAKADIGIKSVKEGGVWQWLLPKSAKDTPTQEVGGLGSLESMFDIDPSDIAEDEEEGIQDV